LLSLDDVECLGAGAQLGAKLGQVLGQTQVARPIGGCKLERFQLGVDRLLLFAQSWHPLPKLSEGQQFLLIGGQQPLDSILQSSLLLAQMLLTLAQGIRVSCRFHAPIDLGLDQRGIFQQSDDLAPHELIQVILPHRAVVAQRAAQMPVGVRPEAAIVIEFSFGCPRRSAIQSVTALPAYAGIPAAPAARTVRWCAAESSGGFFPIALVPARTSRH
jgi:hypothetical protein